MHLRYCNKNSKGSPTSELKIKMRSTQPAHQSPVFSQGIAGCTCKNHLILLKELLWVGYLIFGKNVPFTFSTYKYMLSALCARNFQKQFYGN